MNTEIIKTDNEKATVDLGSAFAERLKQGDSVAFYGELGTGKTEFIKGICEFFKVDEIVSSPTFTIFNQYNGNLDGEDIQIFHIDLYRIKDAKELDEIGFKECFFSEESIKLVEWAEKTKGNYSWNYEITLKADEKEEDARTISITTN